MNTVEFNTIIRKMNKNNTGIHGYFEYGNGTNNTKHLKSDWYKNKIDGRLSNPRIQSFLSDALWLYGIDGHPEDRTEPINEDERKNLKKTIKLFEDKLEKEMDDINQDLPDSKQLTKNAVIKKLYRDSINIPYENNYISASTRHGLGNMKKKRKPTKKKKRKPTKKTKRKSTKKKRNPKK